ncbi:DegT/DnrJ/EryC1/StrS aminotransferase family protein [Thalassospiraceae bacterium LMO-SO8]|nr:DegT/DnrJ/EryC1/StrS aminotransferase family protein [Alphaproteobacteria bacterium LMO-S08]WND77621.1 DegT/DnrJ/EryC1/StrS aminotransferase family protein [Thalassospiraceae bacterium LMO-SO8]
MSASPIAFIDLQAQRARLGDTVDRAIAKVLDHGRFIMGPEVAELETRLAEMGGAKHCVSCSSGTDSLLLVLMAWDIGPGDAVIVPAMTFASTAEVVALTGATPVFCDVLPDTFNMDPASVEGAIAVAKDNGLTLKAIIPVDLFGQPADYPAIQKIADAHGLKVMADSAQSYGGALGGKPVGSWGDATSVSFFPAKPLGCYGDGGAVLTDDGDLAARMRSLRVHGQGTNKYDNVAVGLNARLDTLQAAILLAKLDIFEDEINLRQDVAARYAEGLAGIATPPAVVDGAISAWAQYTIRVADRDAVAAALKEKGVPTAVYYPVALSDQPAYAHYPRAGNGTPVSQALAHDVLSLPMHPYLDAATQDRILAALKEAVAA